MRKVQLKFLSFVLASIFFLSTVITCNVPVANAAIGEDDLGDIAALIAKFQKLSTQQVQDALDIGKRIIVDSSTIPDILNSEQKQLLRNLGLTNAQIVSAYTSVMTQLNTPEKIKELQTGGIPKLVSFCNTVEASFSQELKSALVAKGLTVFEVVKTALDVAELSFNPFGDIPKAELEAIFTEDTGISAETAARYGLNWANVEALRDSLTLQEKEQLIDILVTIGNVSDNADLSELTVSSGKLDPAFAPAVTAYTVVVDSSVDRINVTPTAADAAAVIKVNGTVVASGTASGDVSLSEGSSTVITVAVTAQSETEKGYTLTVIRPKGLPAPATGGTITLEDATTPVSITVPAGVTGAKIQAASVDPATNEAIFPFVQAQVISNMQGAVQGTIAMQIPQGTVVKGPAGWDGSITLPTVKLNSSESISNGTVNAVVEIGLPDGILTFDQAVRLLIPGQAGKSVAYKRGNNAPVPITRIISADSQAAANAELGDEEDGKLDVGADLVIWTKHFTTFIVYKPTSSGGGGGGGGGGTLPGVSIVPSKGGTVELADAVKLEIPAGALKGTATVKVLLERVVTTPPAVPSGFRLLGDVYALSIDGKSNYTFNEPGVTLTFTFDPAALDPGEKPIAAYYDETAGSWVDLGGDVSDNTISVTIDHFTKFAVLAMQEEEEEEPPVVSLNDIAGHWAEDNIKQLVARDAITGYPDGSFKPDNNITRAEFATVLVKAFGLAPQSGKVFTDTGSHWAKDFIATAASYGIIKGYNDVAFGPDDLITREQMAVMIARAAQLAAVSDGTPFGDAASISDWAKDAVAAAVEAGIIQGYPDNTFKPQANATRAEAVTVIVNALK
ncbi:Cellulosome-anchoring protein precursor [Pelotomaculum schinkii]|uniref:Cellulosome-anchoring protein n=1 Tax=Pelotomaculum schinkii TaxID=78350 RepID=A0A4Y7RHU4_9FIRM|nr:S-layer homology domain-containing protein [Pelotomaculum schinkii]TEB08363.1 Cellulosome-anchoring protein precursor [Pelotomaculum schinkii]